jgi:alpha-L-fucosidase
MLVRSASAGANYLLNVGPTPEGNIVPLHAERLRQVGAWLRAYDESIYGTRAGAIPPTAFTVSTQKAGTHYLHALDYISDGVLIKDASAGIQHAHAVKDGSELTLEPHGDDLLVLIPEGLRDPYDTVIALHA